MLGKRMTACLTAAAAVGPRQHFLHLVNPRIFLNLEFLCNKVKNHGKDSTKNGDDCNSPNDCLCHGLII